MVTLVIGEMGSGKTSYLKSTWLYKTIKKILCYALMRADMGNYEYERNFKQYIEKAVTKSDMLFVVDEAKTAIPKKEPDASQYMITGKKKFDYELVTWFLNSRKCNNAIFIVFHGWREVPLWLLMYTNYVVRFRTKDQINIQKRRFESFQPIIDSFENYPTMKRFEYDEIKIQN